MGLNSCLLIIYTHSLLFSFRMVSWRKLLSVSCLGVLGCQLVSKTRNSGASEQNLAERKVLQAAQICQTSVHLQQCKILDGGPGGASANARTRSACSVARPIS